MKDYLLFDIGGTKLRLGISHDGSHIEQYRIVPTPQNFTEGMSTIGKIVHEITSQKAAIAVGGIAGSLSVDKKNVFVAPHLSDWNGKPLKEELAKAFNCPVILENDTVVAGLGEAVMGAGKGFRIVAYVTISTGVNGVKITDGKIEPSYQGYEIGHQIIDMDAQTTSHDHGRGELEDFISGAAIEKRLKQSPLEIEDPAFWIDIARYTSVGLYNVILHWSPEIVVIGGSLMKKIDIEVLRNHLREIMTIFSEFPRLEKATLGELGGLYGALYLGKQVLV